MKLAHYEPLSLADFPGKLATTVFTIGCNFACPYCHNPELVRVTEATPRLTDDEFFGFLVRRQGKLNGVCITGGEPALHADLPEFIERIRALGYAVKLDTNGSSPDMLGRLLDRHMLEYVAMDIKASLPRYAEVAGDPGSCLLVEASIRLLGTCSIAHEFRTTVLPQLFDEKDIDDIAAILPKGSTYVLQNFVLTKTLDRAFADSRGFEPSALEDIAGLLRSRHPTLHITTRGGI